MRRVEALCTAVREMAKQFPAEALQLLSGTMGCCRVEFLLQCLPCSPITDEIARRTIHGVHETLKAVLNVGSLPDDAWNLALLPLRLGGLGIRDAVLVRPAARLASVVNVRSYAKELGADETALTMAMEEVYYAALELPFVEAPVPTPDKELQATLSEPLVLRRRSALVEKAQ